MQFGVVSWQDTENGGTCGIMGEYSCGGEVGKIFPEMKIDTVSNIFISESHNTKNRNVL